LGGGDNFIYNIFSRGLQCNYLAIAYTFCV